MPRLFELSSKKQKSVLVFLVSIIFCTKAKAFETDYSIQYFSKGIIYNNIRIEVVEDITDRTSTFLHLSTFNTRDINGQSRNYSSSIGLKYNLLCINNNMLSLILSYYRVMSYNKLLHFTQLDEIYNKLKTGITYNYDNSFSVGILYNKFYNSYKNSLKFFIEKTLLKNSYFISYLGYEHYRNINTSNSGTISYYYNNIQNLLQIKELLNREDILYWNTKVSFIKHTNISISIKFIDSLAFGKYSSIGLAFGFDI